MSLLEIRNLNVRFATASGWFIAVEGVDLAVDKGEIVAIVGESGSGKSVSMLAVMGLLPPIAKVTADVLTFGGKDLLTMTPSARRAITGADMAMIFQEPMSSLNPCFTVGFQIEETIRLHMGLNRRQARDRAAELLTLVGIPSPGQRLKSFPHQLSGGMSQRVMIAMAISCDPRLLIADEPTTALDVTIQAQILDLLVDLQEQRGMALVLITHAMGVVAETAQRVVVQYAGRQVERQDVLGLFDHPHHPYTAALLAALPSRAAEGTRLASIPGVVPSQFDKPSGCLFHPRCGYADERCVRIEPVPAGPELGMALCHYPLANEQ